MHSLTCRDVIIYYFLKDCFGFLVIDTCEGMAVTADLDAGRYLSSSGTSLRGGCSSGVMKLFARMLSKSFRQATPRVPEQHT
jgi:hypothetical protein